MSVILETILGSHAYGLATPDSDIDKMGVFVAPMNDVLVGLSKAAETRHRVSDDEDYTYHELGKFVKLSLNANPTIMETLFVDDFTILAPEGQMLVDIRHAFLSQEIRKTYGGYARQQAERLIRRGGSYSSDLNKRKAKHSRHIARLMLQCIDALRTGTLHVRLTDFQINTIREVETMPDDKVFDWFVMADEKMQSIDSVLPEKPDQATAYNTLVKIRRTLDESQR